MKKLSDVLFLSCAIYFVAMATAHFFSIKVPLLFIYYDVPFYAYQDKIISFSVLAYVLLFIEAYRNVSVRYLGIILLYITSLGLTCVNLSSDLRFAMLDGQSTMPYWLQTIGIYCISFFLHISHVKSKLSR